MLLQAAMSLSESFAPSASSALPPACRIRWLRGCALVLGACGLLPMAPAVAAGATGQVIQPYVLMADSPLLGRTVALVRVVLAQPTTACPVLELGAGAPPLAMSLRANPNPAAFGVAVCEAVVEPAAGGPVTLAGWEGALPVPAGGAKRLRKVAVVGDSGCKGGGKQTCDGAAVSWPFPKIAAAAAAGAPDLVIHVGDYNYRGTPNKTAEGQWSYDGCVPEGGGPLVRQSAYDTWTTWSEDFFAAAKPLLEAAPWVFVRGNHELCSRAGQGWFYFLDPHSALLDPYQEVPSCDAPTVRTQPYKLSFENLDLVVLDTANACGGEDPETAAGAAYEVRGYRMQLAAVDALLSQKASVEKGRAAAGPKSAWLLGHRPIWSLGQESGSAPASENLTLQAALAATPSGRLPEAIRMVVSGHMHQFFSMSFEGPRPPQLVVGNSGVVLSANDLASPYSYPVDGLPASGLSENGATDYGYLEATVTDGGHWSGTVHAFDGAGNPQPTPVATCGLPATDGRLCRAPTTEASSM